MPDWTIERTTGGRDLDAVAAIEAASFPTPWSRAMLARDLENAELSRLYVLRDPDRRILAFCLCWLLEGELQINTLAVDPPQRRRGLASALLAHVLGDAAGAGAVRATLDVRRSNAPALALYARFGFVVTAVRPRYYSQPDEDALILWRHDLREPSAPRPLP